MFDCGDSVARSCEVEMQWMCERRLRGDCYVLWHWIYHLSLRRSRLNMWTWSESWVQDVMFLDIWFSCVVGPYMPSCDEDGFYKPQQCHGSSGQCWCVDRYGNEVAGSHAHGPADCGERWHFIEIWANTCKLLL